MIVRYDGERYNSITAEAIVAAAIATAVDYVNVAYGVELPETPLVIQAAYEDIADSVVLPVTPLVEYVTCPDIVGDVVWYHRPHH